MKKEPFNFSALSDSWSAPIVARNQKALDLFSGGILNARSLCNADSLGTGPKGKLKMGNKVAYTVESLIEWMNSRLGGVANG